MRQKTPLDFDSSARSTKGCFYSLKDGYIEVSLGLKFDKNEDNFEDVTFRVANCASANQAIRRVEKFVRILADEFGERVR